MGKYFTVTELIRSAEATKHSIDNTPPPEIKVKLNYTINNLLDPIRERWDAPIYVTSGYRCPELNRRVKGATNSQHVKGEAVDITTRKIGSNRVLFDLIRTMQTDGEIVFDQLIDEYGYSWLHISIKTSNNRNEILHIE